MDENKVDGSIQEAQSTGVEAQAEQTAEAVAAETQPAAGATQPAAEPKNDTETEHAAAGKEPEKGEPAAGTEAKTADAGAAVPDPVAELVVANQRITDMSAMLLNAKAEAKAAMLGVKPERIKHAVRMAELSGIDPMTEVADATISDKLSAVIHDLPEILGSSGTGSSGAFRRQDTTSIDPFTKGFKQG